ncbi:MAG: protein kinase [Myxococcales bacterium]|nr:protein kinase [Myxococcales bacterium]
MSSDDPRLSPLTDSEPRRELGAAFGAPSDSAEELGLDDAGLIAEYLGGNPAAYGELVRRHQIAIFRLLLGLLADEDLAEEACERVFVVAERRLPDLAAGNAFYQWILAIAREVALEFNNRAALAETTAPTAVDPRDRLKREIHAVLQKLAPDQRLVLVLVELRGAPDGDVAAALGIDPAEVPALVAAARAEFARVLDARAVTGTDPQHRGDPVPGAPRLRDGDVIAGRYRVERPLAEGGMGAVYLATRVADGERVALKTILPELVTDETSLRRFDREITAIARIDHPNFVRVLDHGRDGAVPFLVMELLDGRSLADVLREQTALSPARALALLAGALHGLSHAHAAGVVHRDLKPDNLFVVDPDGARESLKILDLGLAKVALTDDGRSHTALTERGMVFGTPAYMSPEQALGEEVDARSDLYSLAVVLFHLLTGRLPFVSSNNAALLVMHVSSAPPRLVDVAPHLRDPALQTLLDRGLAKRPEERPPDAAAYLAAFNGVLRTTAPDERPRGAPPVAPPAAAPPSTSSRYFSGLSRPAMPPRDRTLFAAGLASLGLAALAVVLGLVDDRVLGGVGVWLKPGKFGLAIGLYLLTMAFVLPWIPRPRVRGLVRWMATLSMLVELACIYCQAARGVASHFNVDDPLDALVYGLMGVGIAVNVAANTITTVALLRAPLALDAPLVLGIRLGLLLLLLGTLEGGAMLAFKAHTVGAPDGGPGLPVVGWSRIAGDLRVAHFLGMHGLQILPLLGLAMRRSPRGSAVVAAAALALALATLASLALALAGRPLV